MTITNVIPSHFKFKLMLPTSGGKKKKNEKEKERNVVGDSREEGSILIFGLF